MAKITNVKLIGISDAVKAASMLDTLTEEDIASALLKLEPLKEIQVAYLKLLNKQEQLANLRCNKQLSLGLSFDDEVYTDGKSSISLTEETVTLVHVDSNKVKSIAGVTSCKKDDYVSLQATVKSAKIKNDFLKGTLPSTYSSAVTSKDIHQVKLDIK